MQLCWSPASVSGGMSQQTKSIILLLLLTFALSRLLQHGGLHSGITAGLYVILQVLTLLALDSMTTTDHRKSHPGSANSIEEWQLKGIRTAHRRGWSQDWILKYKNQEKGKHSNAGTSDSSSIMVIGLNMWKVSFPEQICFIYSFVPFLLQFPVPRNRSPKIQVIPHQF